MCACGEVTLSSEWKTSELRQVGMAIARGLRHARAHALRDCTCTITCEDAHACSTPRRMEEVDDEQLLVGREEEEGGEAREVDQVAEVDQEVLPPQRAVQEDAQHQQRHYASRVACPEQLGRRERPGLDDAAADDAEHERELVAQPDHGWLLQPLPHRRQSLAPEVAHARVLGAGDALPEAPHDLPPDLLHALSRGSAARAHALLRPAEQLSQRLAVRADPPPHLFQKVARTLGAAAAAAARLCLLLREALLDDLEHGRLGGVIVGRRGRVGGGAAASRRARWPRGAARRGHPRVSVLSWAIQTRVITDSRDAARLLEYLF